MTEIALTVSGRRGCGERKPGAAYLCLGIGDGAPIWYYLLDPPVKDRTEPWQGMTVLTETVEAVLLGDYVSERDYPSVAHFVEETRRLGLSRLIPRSFDFERLRGKRVYIALYHRRAVPGKVTAGTQVKFPKCRVEDAAHYPRCVYHSWLDFALRGEKIKGASFEADPRDVAGLKDQAEGKGPVARATEWGMGAFAIIPVTHIEAVKALPKEALQAGLPVVVRGK